MPLTGVSGTGQPGTLIASPSYALTGNQATGSVGSLADSVDYGLTGVEGTGQVGTLGVPGDVTRALTGVESTGQVGTLSAIQPLIVIDTHDGAPQRIKREREKREKQREAVERAVNGPEVVVSEPPSLPAVEIPAKVSEKFEYVAQIPDDEEVDLIVRMVIDAEERRVKAAVMELLALL